MVFATENSLFPHVDTLAHLYPPEGGS